MFVFPSASLVCNVGLGRNCDKSRTMNLKFLLHPFQLARAIEGEAMVMIPVSSSPPRVWIKWIIMKMFQKVVPVLTRHGCKFKWVIQAPISPLYKSYIAAHLYQFIGFLCLNSVLQQHQRPARPSTRITTAPQPTQWVAPTSTLPVRAHCFPTVASRRFNTQLQNPSQIRWNRVHHICWHHQFFR